jgi:hypothetical protein
MRFTSAIAQSIVIAFVYAVVIQAGLHADEVQLLDGERVRGVVCVFAEDGGVVIQLADGERRELAAAAVLEVQSPQRGTLDYARFSRYRDSWSRLEVLSRTFASADGKRRVTLAGAVHIADLAYYDVLQNHLDAHDIVLCEGVGVQRDFADIEIPTAEIRAEELANPPGRRGLRHSELVGLDFISSLQEGMAKSLDLTFQRDGLDYSHSWWLPADVTSEGLLGLIDESENSVFMDMFAGSNLRMEIISNNIMFLAMTNAMTSVFTRKPMEMVIKEAFAELLISQMLYLGGTATGQPVSVGPEPGDVDSGEPEASSELPRADTWVQEILIQGRNKVVIRRLEEVLNGAPDVESIAIFYGAAHQADLQQRLERLGFKPVRDEWFPAWDMSYDLKPLISPEWVEKVKAIQKANAERLEAEE